MAKNCQKKFGMVTFGYSKFIPVFLGKIIRKKFGMTIFGHMYSLKKKTQIQTKKFWTFSEVWKLTKVPKFM